MESSEAYTTRSLPIRLQTAPSFSGLADKGCKRRVNGATICLVTSANLAANPRLVKEASTLRESGYRVRIVAADIMPSLAGYDSEIAKEVAD